MFENKVVKGVYGYVHYSRFIASYAKIASKYGKRFEPWGDFKEWLESIGKLTEDEIHAICNMASNGKLELEVSAESWFKKKEN